MFNKKLRQEIKNQDREINELKAEVESLLRFKVQNKELKIINEGLVNQLNDANSKIRAQTESDLYFECAKLMKKLEAGEKKEGLIDSVAHRNDMQSQLLAQQQISWKQYYGSFYGGGLGNLFR